MKTEFRRRADGNYMVISKEETTEDIFSERMISRNHIQNLLQLVVENINGTKNYLYNISSLQSFSKLYENKKITGKELERLIKSFLLCRGELLEHLLDTEGIIITPEKIFMGPEEDVFFCYVPGVKGISKETLGEFIEYLIEKTDEGEAKALKRLFTFRKKMKEENFDLSDALNAIDTEINSSRIKVKSINTTEGVESEEAFESVYNELREPEKIVPLAQKKREDAPDVRIKAFDSIKTFFKSHKLLAGDDEWLSFDEEAGLSEGTTFLKQKPERVRRLVGTGECRDQQLEIPGFPCTIGKNAREADLILDSPAVSRMHARIYSLNEEGLYAVEDLNSTNGTFLNDIKIQPYSKETVRPGDVICLGDREYCFK